MNSSGHTIEVEWRPSRRGLARSASEPNPNSSPPLERGQTPRIARLMALAIYCDELLEQGIVRDQAELARLGSITRARMSQIMALLHLAPDIQEAILFLPRISTRGTSIVLADLRPVARALDWETQRMLWKRLQNELQP